MTMPETSTAPALTAADIREAQFGFLTGTAGTGKTFTAREWGERPDTILCATTGIASINLSSNVTTINALLSYFNTESLRDAYIGGFLSSKLRKLYRAGIRRICLDETSMLDGDQLTLLTKAIEEANGKGYVLSDGGMDGEEGQDEERDPEEDPLGLTLVGDFAQLAPVKAPYAFESVEWSRYDAQCCRLTTIYRQEDKAFIEALAAVRVGNVRRALEYFAPRLTTEMDTDFDGSTILAKNDGVSRFNLLRLEQLHTPVVRYESSRWGKLSPAWGGPPRAEPRWGIPSRLDLKEGALVMVLANHRRMDITGMKMLEFEYVNGDLGIFRGNEDRSPEGGACALVTLRRTGETVEVEYVHRHNLIPLEVGRRKELKEAGKLDLIDGKLEIVGGVSYMPLRLAWATTVHKSQGLTLDALQVNLRDHFFKTPGMLFVALSRARSPGGLRVIGTPQGFAVRCQVDEKVRGWL